MWESSIQRRQRVAAADPGNERAQRNLANGYGPLAKALDALQRHAEARVWYLRENKLLAELRVRHPQVKALVARLDESDRDLALQDVLTGRVAEGVARFQALDARRADRRPQGRRRRQVRPGACAGAAVRAAPAGCATSGAGEPGAGRGSCAAMRRPNPSTRCWHVKQRWARSCWRVHWARPMRQGPASWCRKPWAALETLVLAQRLPATVLGRLQDAQAAAKCGPGATLGG